MANIIKDEAFDYYQEVARSAFADMLHDTERNQKYSSGIKEAIETMKNRGLKANVLDIGTGTGLLAMLAAQHGADSVVTIEAFSPVSHIARKIIEVNGFKDKIKIVNKHSTEIKVGEGKDMEQKANILVAEVLDTELIGEGAVKTYNHAHCHLMEKDCLCVPESAAIYIQVVDSPTVVAWNTFNATKLIKCPENVAQCSGLPAIHDLQLSQFPLDKFTALSAPIKVCDIDFSGSEIPQVETFTREFQAATDGEANAVFFWWDIKMNPSGSILLSCAPHWNHPDTEDLAKSKDEVTRRNAVPWRDHWMQGCFYLKSRLNVDNSKKVFITATHDEFSWWFDISRDSQEGSEVERPSCTCMFHIVNSRNRISQINDKSKLDLYLKALKKDEKKFLLFVGDHNLMALTAATSSKVALLQEDVLCYRSIYNFVVSNDSIKTIKLVNDFEELEDDEITHVIAEPHYNNSVLPWDNITSFFKQIKKLRKLQNNFKTLPVAASIHALPVHFLHLHKIRWPLKSSVEGFDHQLFDDVVSVASSLADENVEPFSLWEYPCIALGSPSKVFEINFDDVSIKDAAKTLDVEDFSANCNGIAFWVEWKVDDNSSIACGPSSTSSPGELVEWKMEERQGVHLIPSTNIEAGDIKSINIKTRFDSDDERLAMDFTYDHHNL